MNNRFITKSEDLTTSIEQTRAGFVDAALEKNRKAKSYITAASTLKVLASKAQSPKDLLGMPEIRSSLLTASGLSDKSLMYFTEYDKTEAINKLIDEFLIPSGALFVDELVYRFLLIKGDTLGGEMRNFVGTVAKMKLIRRILSVLSTMGVNYRILYKKYKKRNYWQQGVYSNDYDHADEVAAITWKFNNKSKVLFFDTKISLVNKNIDICLYQGDENDYNGGSIENDNNKALLFGELKGGIDPAGADEHWKTGNSALDRIRTAFINYSVKTIFIGAAIESNMATEIWSQLHDGKLDNAANLTYENQLVDLCEWIVKL